MSYPLDQLPDLAPLGGHWTTAVVSDSAYPLQAARVGRAHLPGVTWPYEPHHCPITRGTWYLDGQLLLCDGCGVDGT